MSGSPPPPPPGFPPQSQPAFPPTPPVGPPTQAGVWSSPPGFPPVPQAGPPPAAEVEWDNPLAIVTSAALALVAGVAVTLLWWLMLGKLHVILYVLTLATGGAIGAVARIGIRGRHLPLGLIAAVISFLSIVAMLYFVARTNLVDDLGARYSVPFWTGSHEAWLLIKAELKHNPILYLALVAAPVLAFRVAAGYGAGFVRSATSAKNRVPKSS